MEIGALWNQTAKSTGKTFMSGKISIPGLEIPIAIFANENKTAGNHPDFKIVWSQPKDGGGQQGGGMPNTGSMPNTGVPAGFNNPPQGNPPQTYGQNPPPSMGGGVMNPGMPGYNGNGNTPNY